MQFISLWCPKCVQCAIFHTISLASKSMSLNELSIVNQVFQLVCNVKDPIPLIKEIFKFKSGSVTIGNHCEARTFIGLQSTFRSIRLVLLLLSNRQEGSDVARDFQSPAPSFHGSGGSRILATLDPAT